MFPVDDPEERFLRACEALPDEPLLHLAARPEQLTDQARVLVFAEVRRRRLTLPPKAATAARRVEDEVFPPTPPGESIRKRELCYARPGDYAELAPADCAFPLPEQPHAMRVALALADIPYDEFWPSGRADLREPFLAVRPEPRSRSRRADAPGYAGGAGADGSGGGRHRRLDAAVVPPLRRSGCAADLRHADQQLAM